MKVLSLLTQEVDLQTSEGISIPQPAVISVSKTISMQLDICFQLAVEKVFQFYSRV